MRQNIAFGGTPEIIHNGGSSVEWTPTAVQGAWNFASSAKFEIDSGANNDEATFAEETPTTIDMSGFSAFTGKVDLETYDSVQNSLTIQFDNAGVLVGNSVNLNDFIDTGEFTEQSFAIAKSFFGLTTQLLDGMSLKLGVTGGSQPKVIFDDFQFEATGNPAIFTSTTPVDTRFHVKEVVIRIEDAFDSTLANATVPNIPINTLLGVASLTNGINVSIVTAKADPFTATLRNLGDFLAVGIELFGVSGDATNTGFSLSLKFPEPVVLEGSSGDFISLTINDNLSGLTRFTAVARGALEV